jgi:hypothetical protein
MFSKKNNLLDSVPIVPLYQHDLLSDMFTLLNRAEADKTCKSRISFLTSMSDAHTTTNGDIETLQFTILIDDSDKANIIGENINIIGRWNRNSDFILQNEHEPF